MKSNEYVLDVPGIQKTVGEKHKAFLKEYGPEVEKVLADHSLFADIMLTKLYRIVLIFREEGIINDVRVSGAGPCKKLTLTKSYCNNYVSITTNGKEILMEGSAYSTEFTSDNVFLRHKIHDANLEDFNWIKFSEELLDYIHKVIYERTSAVETKLQELFDRNSPPEDNVKIIDKTKREKS